jgi:hypothetical protein
MLITFLYEHIVFKGRVGNAGAGAWWTGDRVWA